MSKPTVAHEHSSPKSKSHACCGGDHTKARVRLNRPCRPMIPSMSTPIKQAATRAVAAVARRAGS
jgi:hypothetical protein